MWLLGCVTYFIEAWKKTCAESQYICCLCVCQILCLHNQRSVVHCFNIFTFQYSSSLCHLEQFSKSTVKNGIVFVFPEPLSKLPSSNMLTKSIVMYYWPWCALRNYTYNQYCPGAPWYTGQIMKTSLKYKTNMATNLCQLIKHSLQQLSHFSLKLTLPGQESSTKLFIRFYRTKDTNLTFKTMFTTNNIYFSISSLSTYIQCHTQHVYGI